MTKLDGTAEDRIRWAMHELLRTPLVTCEPGKIAHTWATRLRPVEQKWLGMRLGVFGYQWTRVKDIAQIEAVTSARVSQVTRGALKRLAEMLSHAA